MILPRFDVLVPETIDEACSMMAHHVSQGVKALAGGTDLLVDLRRPIIPEHVPRCDGCATHPKGGVLSTLDCSESSPLMSSSGSQRGAAGEPFHKSPAFLVSLHRLTKLKGMERLEDGRLRVGALTTITEIERSEEARDSWTALAEGADNLGSPLVRNRGTIGGNIVNARPAADMTIPTIALNGSLILRSTKGMREIPAADFHLGPGRSVIQPDELLTEILFPEPAPFAGSAYYKLANRKALEISTVGVAVWLALKEPNGPIGEVRVVLGAVGPTPILAKSVSAVVAAKIPDDKTVAEAARAAAGDARPIDDHRGSAWYRVRMVEILTARLLKIAVKRAGSCA